MDTELLRAASVIAAELHIRNDIAMLSATGTMQDLKVYYHDLHCVFNLAKRFEDYFERGNEDTGDDDSHDSLTGMPYPFSTD